jgi:hypothetical protein
MAIDLPKICNMAALQKYSLMKVTNEPLMLGV